MKNLILILISCFLFVSCTKDKTNNKLSQSSTFKADRKPTNNTAYPESTIIGALKSPGIASDLSKIYALSWKPKSELINSQNMSALIKKHNEAFATSLAKKEFSRAYLNLHMSSLEPFGGFLYKMSDIVQKLGNRQMHNGALSLINSIYGGLDLNISAGTTIGFHNYLLDYVAFPPVTSVNKFTDSKAFFNFVCPTTKDKLASGTGKICDIPESKNSLYCKLEGNHQRLESLYNEMIKSGEKFIAWDNMLVSSSNSFTDESNRANYQRYFAITGSELLGQLANNKSILSNLATTCAYNFEGSLGLVNNLSEAFISGTILPGFKSYQGVPASERKAVLKAHRKNNPNFGKLRDDSDVTVSTGRRLMGEAWTHLQQGLAHFIEAESVASYSYRSNADLFSNIVFFGDEKAKKLMMSKVTSIQKDGVFKVTSFSNNKSITVNVRYIYGNPPEDLIVFAPTAFNTGVPKEIKVNSRTNLRNYRYGRATTWSKDAYAKYITGLDSTTNTSVIPDLMRTASTSFGGGLILGPLAFIQ